MSTPSGKKPLVSYLIISYNRREDLAEVMEALLRQTYPRIEIVVVDNHSSDGTEELFAERFALPHVRFYEMEENLGVSGGRNVALQKATGEILITIDDDAVLDDPNYTNLVVGKFEAAPDVGVLGFMIVDYFTGRLQKNAFPSRDKKRDPTQEFETTWFIGAGHAVRKEVYDKVGLYRDYRPWGSEEYDLSLRIVDAGYRILYFPSIVVRHKISQLGRISSVTHLKALALKHRVKAAILNLPWYCVLTMLIVRSGQILVATRGNVAAVLLAYYWLARDLPSLLRERKPIGAQAICRLKALRGNLYY